MTEFNPNKSEKGFSVVAVSLAVAVLAVVGGVSYVVIRHNTAKQRATNSSNSAGNKIPTRSQNNSNVLNVTEQDNNKTITVHIGKEIVFNPGSSLTWYYSEVESSGSENPLSEKANGDYVAQSIGSAVMSASSISQPTSCPSNAACVPVGTTNKFTVTINVVQ